MPGKRKKYKLILINPINKHRKGFVIDSISKYPPLNLALIASLTTDNWAVKIIDEQFDDFTYEEANLVGITAFTAQINRAYEIASLYCKQGIKTVIGGIHASSLPEEAGKFADVIVCGEAEGIWPQVIKDFENNTLKKRYDGELAKMNMLPKARHDLLHADYLYSPIQTTRGCPMQCEFCSVHQFNGKKFRTRPVDDVLNEMEIMPDKRMAIIDDNIIGYTKSSQQRAIALFKGMIKRKINKEWFAQASINFADNDDVLKYAFEAGCRMVLIGIESEKLTQLKEQKKTLNIRYQHDKYEEVFRRIKRNGISVLGTFIFGLDSDTVEDLHQRADYIINCGVDCYQTSVLTPLPGTKLYNKFKSHKRLIDINYPEDWQKYHAFEVVMKPNQMSPQTLKKEMNLIWQKIYDKNVILRKFLNTMKATRNKTSALWALSSNITYHNVTLESTENPITGEDVINQSIVTQ